MREDMTPNPLSPYALQKLVGEQYASMFARLYGMTAVSLRYFNVYGPRQPLEGEYALVIGKFLSANRSGTPMTVYGDGEQTRAYSHVYDVVSANLLAAEADVPAGPEHGAQHRLRRGDVGQPDSRHDRWRRRPRRPQPQGRHGGAAQGGRLLAGRDCARLGADDQSRGRSRISDGRNIQPWIPACAGMTVWVRRLRPSFPWRREPIPAPSRGYPPLRHGRRQAGRRRHLPLPLQVGRSVSRPGRGAGRPLDDSRADPPRRPAVVQAREDAPYRGRAAPLVRRPSSAARPRCCRRRRSSRPPCS